MMRSAPKKINLLTGKKRLVLFFVFCFLFFGAKKAFAWDAMSASIYEIVETEISYAVKGMSMGALKQASIKMLSRQVDRFISGVSGNGARFITNWEDYLIDNPTRNAQRYVNDYISHALSGRGSVSYKKASNSVLGASTISGEGFGNGLVLGTDDEQDTQNYAQTIRDMAQEKIVEPEKWTLSYYGNPEEMFDGTNLADMNKFLSGNTIWHAEMELSKIKEEKLEEEKHIATTEGVSGEGFLGEKIDGMIAKPGILIKEMKANEENLTNLAIVGATNLSELIAATVSKTIATSISRTISGVERTIDREVSKVTNKAIKEVNKSVNAYGPGELYK